MKKNLFVLTLLLSLHFSWAQVRTGALKYEVLDPNNSGKIFRNQKNSGPDKIEGSPYIQKVFAPANVTNVEQKYFMRYNAYEDQFEFITPKNDTLVMDKIDDFGLITFNMSNKKFKLVDYLNLNEKMTKGYLIELYTKGDLGLYKKESVSFRPGKKAKTSLEVDMPAKYIKNDDTYYLKNKSGNIAVFPESKKQLVKLFPEKKSEIESFVKQNDIKFDQEMDLKKIIDLIATF